MPDREKVLNDLRELCEYLFHEYKVCYHGDEEDTYNRFLAANTALNLLKQQPEIVRCKDCIHWDDDDCEIGNNPQMFADDWYCPCGEVKQDARS